MAETCRHLGFNVQPSLAYWQTPCSVKIGLTKIKYTVSRNDTQGCPLAYIAQMRMCHEHVCAYTHGSLQFYRNPLFQQCYKFNLCAHTLSTNYESFPNPLNHHRHVVSALLSFLDKWGHCSQKKHLGLSVTQCGYCYDSIIISTLTRTWNFAE